MRFEFKSRRTFRFSMVCVYAGRYKNVQSVFWTVDLLICLFIVIMGPRFRHGSFFRIINTPYVLICRVRPPPEHRYQHVGGLCWSDRVITVSGTNRSSICECTLQTFFDYVTLIRCGQIHKSKSRTIFGNVSALSDHSSPAAVRNNPHRNGRPLVNDYECCRLVRYKAYSRTAKGVTLPFGGCKG